MNHLALTSYLGTLAEVGFVNEFRQVVPTRTTNITTIEVGDTSKISGDETGADIAEGSTIHYLACLRQAKYSCILFDGSLVQLKYSTCEGRITNHRYLYFPCPAKLDLRSTADETIYDIVDDACLAGALDAPRLGFMRFDFEPPKREQDRRPPGEHPDAHIHIGIGSCRIPLVSPISVDEFFSFLLKFYYAEFWDHEVHGQSRFREPRTILPLEQGFFHFGWIRPTP